MAAKKQSKNTNPALFVKNPSLSWIPIYIMAANIEGNTNNACHVRYRPNIFKKIVQKVLGVMDMG
jgi:hypothetical protein